MIKEGPRESAIHYYHSFSQKIAERSSLLWKKLGGVMLSVVGAVLAVVGFVSAVTSAVPTLGVEDPSLERG